MFLASIEIRFTIYQCDQFVQYVAINGNENLPQKHKVLPK